MSGDKEGNWILNLIFLGIVIWIVRDCQKDINKPEPVATVPVPEFRFEKGLSEGQAKAFDALERPCPKLFDAMSDIKSITFGSYSKNNAWCPYDYLCEERGWHKVITMNFEFRENTTHIPDRFRTKTHMLFKAGGGTKPGVVMRPASAQYLCGIDPSSLGDKLDGFRPAAMLFIDRLNIEIDPEPEPVTGGGLFGNE